MSAAKFRELRERAEPPRRAPNPLNRTAQRLGESQQFMRRNRDASDPETVSGT
jgi:hypothetical protein